jgi:hypothetical protein
LRPGDRRRVDEVPTIRQLSIKKTLSRDYKDVHPPCS